MTESLRDLITFVSSKIRFLCKHVVLSTAIQNTQNTEYGIQNVKKRKYSKVPRMGMRGESKFHKIKVTYSVLQRVLYKLHRAELERVGD